MLKRVIAGVILALVLCPINALALNRVQDLFGQNPLSQWQNMKERDLRIGIGTFWWQIICGSDPTCPGGFTNLTILPVLGLNVAVGPSFANTVGAVYQLLPEETTPFGGYPSGVGTFLAPDATQVVLQGLAPTNTASIGPLSPPGTTGYSIDYLIECQVKTVDTTSQPINIVSTSGNITGTSANRDRNDIVSCQSKAGVPAATGSQVAPSVDSGFVAIGYVAVPFGSSSINIGMIYGYPPLSGYVSLSPANTQSGTINVSGTITSGDGIVANAGTFAGAITSNGITSTGNATTYLASAPTTGTLFFGNGGAQYIRFDGSRFQITAPITLPSIVGNSLISPPGTSLVIGAGTGTTDGTLVNYNTGGGAGLTIYNGGTGLGPLAASSGGFSGALSATSLASSGSVSGTSGSFSGPVSGTSGTFTGGLYSTNGALYLNSGSQYLDFDGTKFIMTAALSVPGVTSSGAISGTTGTFSGGVSSAGLTVPVLNGTLTLGTSGTGNGFVNAAGTDILYLNYVTGTGGIQFCNGANSCLANVTPTGGINGAALSTGGTVTGATFVDTGGVLYLNAADTQYLQYNGNMNFTAPVFAPGFNANGGSVYAGNISATSNSGANTMTSNAYTVNGSSVISALGSNTVFHSPGSGGWYWQNYNDTANVASIDSSGNFAGGAGGFGGVVSAAGFSTGGNTSTGNLSAGGNVSAGGQISGSSASISGNSVFNTITAYSIAADANNILTVTGTNANGALEAVNNACTVGIQLWYTGATGRANVTCAGQFVQVSDRRLKQNIHTIPYGLKTINALRPVAFNWKQDNKSDIGLIAQDVQAVVPEEVSNVNKDGYLGVNYSGLVPVLIKAVQDQQVEIEDLKSQVAELRGSRR